MLSRIAKLDSYGRNILIIFSSTSLVNFFNLLFQLMIAHRFSPADFAVFNSLISVLMMFSAPLATLQYAVAKYCSEYNALAQLAKLKFFLSDLLLKKLCLLAALSLAISLLLLPSCTRALKVDSPNAVYLVSLLVAGAWITPVLLGAAQGLEFFGWLSFSSVLGGVLKLGIGFLLVSLGYRVGGGFLALAVSAAALSFVLYLPLRSYFSLGANREELKYKDFFLYLFPVAMGSFCITALFNLDMVMVKYYFSPAESGVYSLAQMIGKIFLFLPGGVSLVMFPRTSSLKAQGRDTLAIFKRSIFLVAALSICAMTMYNIFPAFFLRLLTGKTNAEAIYLGRYFSVSMSFFTLLFTLVTYFLSIRDFAFIKYLLFGLVAQVFAIGLFHGRLLYIQLVMCVNSALLLFVLSRPIFRKR